MKKLIALILGLTLTFGGCSTMIEGLLGESQLDQSISEEYSSVKEDTMDGESVQPEDNQPADSEETKPEETEPEETPEVDKPEDNQPEGSQPGENTPNGNKPDGNDPENTPEKRRLPTPIKSPAPSGLAMTQSYSSVSWRRILKHSKIRSARRLHLSCWVSAAWQVCMIGPAVSSPARCGMPMSLPVARLSKRLP